MLPPPKAPVAGVPISMTSYEQVLELVEHRPRDRATLIAACNVHSVMSARASAPLALALEEMDVATPDGMPLVWTLRGTANPDQERVYGPDLMRAALRHGVDLGWSHYLYGATSETLALLEQSAERLAPGVRIVGRHAPPFRPLSRDEEARAVDDIRRSGADIVWVGLGMPKQELWMHRVRDALPGVVLVGVGAAFDLLSGRVQPAPPVLQSVGLEWLWRLSREPRRLWRRYLFNNPAFLVLFIRQIVAARRQPRGTAPRSGLR